MGENTLVDSKFGAQCLAASSLRYHISAAGRCLTQAANERVLSLFQVLDLVGRRCPSLQPRPGSCRGMLNRLSSHDCWSGAPLRHPPLPQPLADQLRMWFPASLRGAERLTVARLIL